jgi:hypothetical protein
VHWLYIGDQDVIHIGQARHSEHQNTYLKAPTDGESDDFSAAGAMGSGRIDHLCINCDDLKGFIDLLTKNGVEYNERKAHNSNLYQLFMREPVNGIKVELNFPWHEAVALGLVPGWTDDGQNDKTVAEVFAESRFNDKYLNKQDHEVKA